jgi:hypothetical protein
VVRYNVVGWNGVELNEMEWHVMICLILSISALLLQHLTLHLLFDNFSHSLLAQPQSFLPLLKLFFSPFS